MASPREQSMSRGPALLSQTSKDVTATSIPASVLGQYRYSPGPNQLWKLTEIIDEPSTAKEALYGTTNRSSADG